MREFKFTDQKEFNQTVEELSWKKAVKSIQNKTKIKKMFCEWVGKKGKMMTKWIILPIGRSKKIDK